MERVIAQRSLWSRLTGGLFERSEPTGVVDVPVDFDKADYSPLAPEVPLLPGMEFGSSGLKQTGGYVHEEWLRQLRGQRGIRIYREMRDNNATIGAVLYAIESLILSVRWRVEVPSSNPTPEQIAARDFVEGALFHDMSHTWGSFLSECLSMITYGWSYFEVVYKRRLGDAGPKSSRFADGRIGWQKWAIRGQETLWRWEFDDHGGTQGMHQRDLYNGISAFIPISKALLFTFRDHLGSPEGRSGLRSAYRAWYFLKRLQTIEAIGAERDLAGLPVMEAPLRIMDDNAPAAQKSIRSKLAKIIKNIRNDEQAGVLMPSEQGPDGKPTGYKLRLLTSGGKRAIDIGKSIDRYDKAIAMTFLAQFLFLGMDRVGSFALADNSTDLFAVALGATMDRMTDVVNRHAIPPLMRLNSIPQENWPILTHGDVESRDLAKVSSYVATLIGAGAMTPDGLEDPLREIGHLPPREVEADAEEAPTEAKVLTGIQIQTAANIAAQVKLEELGAAQGIALLTTFFGLSEQAARRIVGAEPDKPTIQMPPPPLPGDEGVTA